MTTPTHEQLLKLKLYLCGKLPERIEQKYHKGGSFYCSIWRDKSDTCSCLVLDTELDYIARLVEEKMAKEQQQTYRAHMRILKSKSNGFEWDIVHDPWHQRALAMARMEGVEI